uniref:Putative nonstructural protein n=1 Tax=Cecropis daurica parvoviridae sp. TaxID=2794470 RepID=A0A8E7L4E9_9VIRU|nr:MAG: putative nonstructural protein [Cecropis daurica parvoviridae sp.]
MYQFRNNGESVAIFLTDLYNILDKRIPKLNTLAIKADPNAGKNFFFDAVAAFFLNYGSIGTANKNNQFAFQEVAHKRMVLWNEPNYETVHIEKLKELLAGDTTRVHVKYQGDAPLQGPPIIILTNDELNIFGMSAFKSRVKLYRWNSCPLLKDYDKKINPLFLLKLFDMYFIE